MYLWHIMLCWRHHLVAASLGKMTGRFNVQFQGGVPQSLAVLVVDCIEAVLAFVHVGVLIHPPPLVHVPHTGHGTSEMMTSKKVKELSQKKDYLNYLISCSLARSHL